MGRHHSRAELGEYVDQIETDDLHLRRLLRRVAEGYRQRHQLRPLFNFGGCGGVSSCLTLCFIVLLLLSLVVVFLVCSFICWDCRYAAKTRNNLEPQPPLLRRDGYDTRVTTANGGTMVHGHEKGAREVRAGGKQEKIKKRWSGSIYRSTGRRVHTAYATKPIPKATIFHQIFVISARDSRVTTSATRSSGGGHVKIELEFPPPIVGWYSLVLECWLANLSRAAWFTAPLKPQKLHKPLTARLLCAVTGGCVEGRARSARFIPNQSIFPPESKKTPDKNK